MCVDLGNLSVLKEVEMFEQLWGQLVLLIPVFLLLALMFGAGFVIGRVTKKPQYFPDKPPNT